MLNWYFNWLLFDPFTLFSGNETDPEKLQLIRVIVIMSIILFLIVGWEIRKFFQNGRTIGGLFRFTNKIDLKVILEKDRLFRPQILTMTIRNIGKNEVDLNAPVIQFRKIWTKRKFKLNGIKGQQVYPLFLQPGITHQLHIETATFHQYDRTIKKYYWACIYVSDVEGRKWRSNEVKLRKSLVT
jgi:hypothetical protein